MFPDFLTLLYSGVFMFFSLQLQLKQAIRLGSPPSLMCVKKTEDGGTMSEDDGLPCSPPEYTTLHTVMVKHSLCSQSVLMCDYKTQLTLLFIPFSQNQPQRNSSNSMEGMDSDDDQVNEHVKKLFSVAFLYKIV